MNHLQINGQLNPEELEEAIELNESLIKLRRLLNGHATSNSNYPRKIGFDLYARNFYNLLILEELIDGKYVNINTLKSKISHKTPKEFGCRYFHEVAIYTYEMCRRKLVEYKTDENDTVFLKITQKGTNAYNDNTFHDLASTSFYGYQSFMLSRNSLFIAVVAILISILTLFLGIVMN